MLIPPDAYLQHMAVRDCISFFVGVSLSYYRTKRLRIGEESKKRSEKFWLGCFYILPVLFGWAVMWLETIKIRLMGD